MELERALNLLKKTVKYTGTNDSKHIDLTLVSTDERPEFEKALVVAQLAIKDGKLSKEEFSRKINLD
jgi:hypothetical protein